MWDGQRGKTLAATMNAPHATRVVSTGSTIGRGPRKISEKIATRIKNKCDPDACPSNNVKLSIADAKKPDTGEWARPAVEYGCHGPQGRSREVHADSDSVGSGVEHGV